jgi:hypothetical protein
MRTEDLVSALVADRAAVRQPLSRRMVAALAGGGVVSLVLFFAAFGVRADISPALATWRFELKLAMVVIGFGLALHLCVQYARPASGRRILRDLLPLGVVAAAAATTELIAAPAASWGTRLVGTNALVCLTAVPLLSLAPLVAVLAALRSGAPSSPALAGGLGGLLAAMTGATLYAFHCFDDSPLFVITWYTLATIPVVLLGALAGNRLLRW